MKVTFLLLITALFITGCDEVFNDEDQTCIQPLNSIIASDMRIPEYIYIPVSTQNQCSTYAEDYINSDENIYTYQDYCSDEIYNYKRRVGYKTTDDDLLALSEAIDESMVEDYIKEYCRPYNGPEPDTVSCFKVKDESISYHYTYDGYKFKGEITVHEFSQGTCPLYTISCYTEPDNSEGDACENMED